MDDAVIKPTVSHISRLCRHALPSTVIESSDTVTWTSALVELHRCLPDADPFDTHPTPDHTIVVMTRGEQRLEAFEGGTWRGADYRLGTTGMTAAGKSDRLRRRTPLSLPFEKANLYVPQLFLLEAADYYRRAGHGTGPQHLTSLAFDDLLVAQTISALLGAIRAGATDLYAETAMRWLATHLLFAHTSRRDLRDDPRQPAPMTDTRLTRVIEYMNTHLGEQLSLDRLAAHACISKFHFARLFRSRTGVSPHAYLVQLRMTAARDLLSSSELSIAEIAKRCGYSRSSQFSAAFNKRYKTPPSVFRRVAGRGRVNCSDASQPEALHRCQRGLDGVERSGGVVPAQPG